jgi:hypothetical protein
MFSGDSSYNIGSNVFLKIEDPLFCVGNPGQIHPMLCQNVVLLEHDSVDLAYFRKMIEAILVVFIIQIVAMGFFKTLDKLPTLLISEEACYRGEDFIFGVDPCSDFYGIT